MKRIKIDVMVIYGERFYKSLTYKYPPLSKLNIGDLVSFVYEKCPSLINRKDVKMIFEEE